MTSLEEIRRHLNDVARESPEKAGALAFPMLLNTGPRLPVRPAEQPLHDRATAGTLDVDGRKLAVYRWGDGERRVLLMHGFEGRASNMTGFVPGLEKLGMSAVAFDFFGHGESEGDRATILDVQDAVRAVEAEHGPFDTIVAHSFGGLCAYQAVRGGVRTDRLVTIASVCDFGHLPKIFCNRLGLDPSIEGVLRRLSEEYFHPETEIWERFSAGHRAAEFTLPLLVVHDENDKEVPVEQGRKLSAAYSRARYIETQGLGHRRIVADPGVISATLEFISAQVRTDSRKQESRG
ncbi:alpha/beta hydrolase [Streptomyces sp. NPDC058231]|uniref:alpha/beta hydrolase n=1 Tax=Streptomyces sp. NPDC058231 TaxID=3346392 RepID=UPI0036ED133C